MQAKFLLWCMLTVFSITASAQTQLGELRGKITDSSAAMPLGYVHIELKRNDSTLMQTYADDEGDFIFKSLAPGIYFVKVQFVGYTTVLCTDIEIKAGTTTTQNIWMRQATELMEVVVTRKKAMCLPQRSVHSVAKITAGVASRSGGTPVIRGARADGTAYYIDGIRVQGGTTNRETYAKVQENAYTSVQQQPLSTFSIDVDKASYANVRRYLSDNLMPPADAVRVEELINYFTYDITTNSSEHPFAIRSEVARSPWDHKKKLVHITLKAPDLNLSRATRNNLTFLIDVSGSMYDADKLPLLKDCLKMLIENLREQDKISIVVYAGAAGVVLKPTSGKDKEDILNALDQLQAGGSTAGGQGIELAYSLAAKHFMPDGNNRIILATDGDFNVGVTSVKDLTKLIEQKRASGIYLSVLGFGRGNINDETMELLADKGNGNYHYIDGLLEGKKVLVTEMGGTLFTVAKDVKIQVEFNPKYVRSYKLLGYENRMLNAEDFNNDKKDAGELGAGHCVTAIYEIMTTDTDTGIDSLRYQQQVLTELANGNELMNIKVRYKKPDAFRSIKFEMPVSYQDQELTSASQEMQFAVSVALFGLKLRNSSFVQQISYNQIISMSKASRGIDENGYRAEFTRLVETAELLASKH